VDGRGACVPGDVVEHGEEMVKEAGEGAGVVWLGRGQTQTVVFELPAGRTGGGIENGVDGWSGHGGQVMNEIGRRFKGKRPPVKQTGNRSINIYLTVINGGLAPFSGLDGADLIKNGGWFFRAQFPTFRKICKFGKPSVTPVTQRPASEARQRLDSPRFLGKVEGVISGGHPSAATEKKSRKLPFWDEGNDLSSLMYKCDFS
jgi:hypothetical protein